MEEENTKKKNIRPTEKSNLPVVTLFVLVILVFAMLYIGYEYMAEGSASSKELTSVVMDTTAIKPEYETLDSGSAPDEVNDSAVVTEPAIKAEVKPETKNAISPASLGGESIKYAVKSGDTWSSIASKFNLKLQTLQGLNSGTTDLKSGTTQLTVQVQKVHLVGPGDVLRVVAGKYNISKTALMQANDKTKDISQRGEKLIIPFSAQK